MKLTAQTPLGDIALQNPASIRFFESLNLDFCCGGHLPLEEACKGAGLEVQKVLADLANLKVAPQAQDDPSLLASGTLTDLISHIEAKHHTFTRQELDRLGPLMAKVLRAHGGRHGELQEISGIVQALEADLRAHLEKEERILFPYIREMESGSGACEACFGTVQSPIGVMEREHEEAGGLLARLKELTNGYEAPADDCTSFRALYQGLKGLEEDLHRHIFLENHLLFPRAIAMEKGHCECSH